MKNQNQTTTNRPNVWELPTTAEELTLCEVIRFLDLRAMHQSNGTDQALQDLIRGCYLDTLALKATDRQTRADTLRATAKAERAIADRARQTLNRVHVTEEERTEAYHIMTQYSTLADNDTGEAQDAEKLNNALTISLAQDMLHTIWIELQAIKADPDRQTEKAFGELCKAGRQYIQSMTAVTAIDSNNTISRPLTTAEAVYYMTRYNVNPASRPRDRWTQTAKGCTGYYTLEAKERKKDTDPRKVDPATIANYARYNDACIWYYENVTLQTTHSGQSTYTLNDKDEVVKHIAPFTTAFPALDAKTIASHFWHRMTTAQKCTALNLDPAENPVLYLVLHIPTIRKQTPVDTMTDHDSRTAQAIADSVKLNVDPVKLAEYAKLSHQARTAIEALTHPEAVQQARTAYREAIEAGKQSLAKLQADRAEAGKKPYNPGKVYQMQKQYKTTADNAYTTALWAYALTKAGYTETAQRKAKSVIRSKLSKALRTAPDAMTPGYIDYARMMGSTARGHATDPGKRADLVNLYQTAEAVTLIYNGEEHTAPIPRQHKPIITWTESGCTPEAINPGMDARAEEVLKRDQYRATAPKATPPELTPKERAERERLCKRDAELAELWKAFEAMPQAVNPYATRA